MTIETPIFIYEPNDLSVFRSLDYACTYIEPIDVHDSVYKGFDAKGHLLDLKVIVMAKKELVVIHLAEAQPTHQAELCDLLRHYLLSCRVSKEWLENADLEALVRKSLEYTID